MKHRTVKTLLYTLAALMLVVLAASGCGPATGAAPATAPEPTAALEAPAGAVRARDAVLDFLRADANCCVPPLGVRWQVEAGRAPAGYEVTSFHAERTGMTVSFVAPEDDRGYHVAFHNDDVGFCWQANVDSQGKVVGTGTAAALWPELADAAAGACQEAGYDYSVESQPDGTSCGICTFPGGSQCKAWLFYQGECGPGEP
jgi:putative hemolysin